MAKKHTKKQKSMEQTLWNFANKFPDQRQPQSEIVIYHNQEGNIKIDVHLEDETVWLTQAQMAVLFNKGRTTITEHIQNIFKEGELIESSVCRKFRPTAADGKVYDTKYYSRRSFLNARYE